MQQLLIILFLIFWSVVQAAPPATREVEQVDTYGGKEVRDPYRWLEAVNSPEVIKWYKEQNRHTHAQLAKAPSRAQFLGELKRTQNFPMYGAANPAGGRVFFFKKNPGADDWNVNYVRSHQDSKERVLINYKTLEGAPQSTINEFIPSPNGQYVAYMTSLSGSDWNTLRIRNVKSGKDLPEKLTGLKWATPSWLPSGEGFFYPRYPAKFIDSSEAASGCQVWFHKLGTPQEQDTLVFTPESELMQAVVWPSDEGRYLFATSYPGSDSRNTMLVFPWKGTPEVLKAENALARLDNKGESEFYALGSEGSRIFFNTTQGAKRGRIAVLDVKEGQHRGIKDLVDLIPEQKFPINASALVVGKIVLTRLVDAESTLTVYDTKGKLLREAALPGKGSVSRVSYDIGSPDLYFRYQSFLEPRSVYRLNLDSYEISLFRRSAPRDFSARGYVTRKYFAASSGNVKVPVFVAGQEKAFKDKKAKIFLSAYGCYGEISSPNFDWESFSWMKQGGLIALAGVRGGGEYGSEWYNDGRELRKQNSVDDFLATASFLREELGSRPLSYGASCGGLLSAAAGIQRPELFQAVIVDVGILDLLRYHLFTGAKLWETELGSTERSREDTENLLKLSPLHAITPAKQYPPFLILTGSNDTRVVPSHSYKFAAALQKAVAGRSPVLLRTEIGAGHNGPNSAARSHQLWADALSFAWENANR